MTPAGRFLDLVSGGDAEPRRVLDRGCSNNQAGGT